MSESNPDGWKLEDLLDVIAADLVVKNANIDIDNFTLKHQIKQNNDMIISTLNHLKKVQMTSINAIADHKKSLETLPKAKTVPKKVKGASKLKAKSTRSKKKIEK